MNQNEDNIRDTCCQKSVEHVNNERDELGVLTCIVCKFLPQQLVKKKHYNKLKKI